MTQKLLIKNFTCIWKRSKFVKDLSPGYDYKNGKLQRQPGFVAPAWGVILGIFLDVSSQAIATKVKINKLDFIKLKSFSIEKESVNKMKRPPTKSENIFSNDVSGKGVISKIYKELMQLNIKKNWKINTAGRAGMCKWTVSCNEQGSEKNTMAGKQNP